MDEPQKYTLAVFASDQGPGDAERSSIMSQAGSFLAKQGAQIICLSSGGGICIPLITSARSAGGEVIIVADQEFEAPSALSDVPVERFSTQSEKLIRVGDLSDAFVGLPGSLVSVTSLFEAWTAAGSGKPVALLNKNRAFEVMRGFVGDIVSSKVSNVERQLQFSDNIEELWSRLSRMMT